MSVSRALRRLLRIREIEEEQCRVALEAALSNLNRMKYALAAFAEQQRRGRRLIGASAYSGELHDRLAGIEEIHMASARAEALAPRIADMDLAITPLRDEFRTKRIERAQAETLMQETEAMDAVEAGRRDQQALDDWYRNRSHRQESEARRAEARAAGQSPRTDESAAPST